MTEPGAESPTRRRGRRKAGADTRATLLKAAREEFMQRGYSGATVRAIAARASVDPAMVNHWFGNKEGLFTAAVSLPVNLADLAQEVVAGDPAQLGERIVRGFLIAWDTAGGSQFMALMRSIATHDESVVMLREFVISVLFGPLTRAIGADKADMRAALCGSQIIGLGLARYVVRLEPLASADHDTIVRAIAPNLQRYLTGEMG